ncbi:NTP transferase domain-containing protein [uncultured Chryseobacterium sp.]|uniref:NTP transferase domain-containing protein n=1 Tax=uncultured Chryseobacterium sp. TaxID=259322 RepID=UPI0025E88622|nr:NTP transferase domain-containing protein [uncultured Chryseobacterium sp.]
MIPLNTPTPSSVNGLVLAGGKSSRMGTAKEKIRWHGKEQQYAMADLLAPFCDKVYISCRPDQLEKVDAGYKALADVFVDMGPVGGILSAFHYRKDTAWLVVACDLPLLDEKAVELLIRSRNPEKMATVYESPVDGGPEPLVALWEPQSFPFLVDFLETGSRSPRKLMTDNDIRLVRPEDPQVLRNVNTPEELAEVRRMIENSR